MVLKVRKVSGVETLSLRHAERGSFAIPRDWTDWAPPGTTSVESINGQRALLVDTLGLLALAELVGSLKRKKWSLTNDSSSESIGHSTDSVRKLWQILRLRRCANAATS